ncbi:hypothetical protein P775_25465 [Puniceibacterium antarcticum]|uniref:ABC transmembrane type-1 domain-containing protein n=1 Tax=Puniceibacterium antarcticum TaxID=1206336 RepID=A0A2G8R1W4_9RHOB|nr:hypothetical protein P775_25465 [Puniceibacterium antarcticum]
MSDATAGAAPGHKKASAAKAAEKPGPMVDAEGRPLKESLNRSLRLQKMRALMLIAPLLIFVLLTFIAPIADMLFRSVQNGIVSETLPRTTHRLADWDATTGDLPDEAVYEGLYYDLFIAAERKLHTRLGSRLNYEMTGMSSLFRQSGRSLDDIGDVYFDQFKDLDPNWDEAMPWAELLGDPEWIAEMQAWDEDSGETMPTFELADGISDLLPLTAETYSAFADYVQSEDGDSPLQEEPWVLVHTALYQDLMAKDVSGYNGPQAAMLKAADAAVGGFESVTFKDGMEGVDGDWLDHPTWETIQMYSPEFTNGYFLNAVDMQKTPDGPAMRDDDQRIYGLLFKRTMFMSLMITGSCILLGYPIAWLLSNVRVRTANLLLILVLLPFWTSLLVRTSAWKVMLQQQGVINDVLVWLGLIADDSRLVMINNQFGTIVAMTHILLPFMILPLYSVMQTIPPTYLRAAKSLGATNWTAFWRVYFPQSVPGIGAGSILVFILSIGYYITPEIVGGTTGTFISNRIAYHISSSLNWGLAAALGTILLALVLGLYYAYDKIVGIDNVKLG